MADSESPPTTRRIIILRTSWRAALMHWVATLVLGPVNTLHEFLFAIPIPRKGPQIWPAAPPNKLLNRLMRKGEQCITGQWVHESSGWVMTTVFPPSGNGVKKDTERIILFFYGSGFTVPPLDWHWGFAGYLARELNAEVVIVPYPLAPTNTAQEVMPTVLKVYEAFLDRAGEREALVVGDSAGGAISLCLAFAAHEAGLPLPSQIILSSPVVNLAMENPSMIPISKHDWMLTREYCRRISLQWAGVALPAKPSNHTLYSVPFPSEVLSDPHINPDAGDLSILAKTGTRLIVISATWDCLHAEIVPFVDKAEKAGVQLTYIEGERQFHDFTITVDVSPECTRAAELVTQTVIANGGKRATGT